MPCLREASQFPSILLLEESSNCNYYVKSFLEQTSYDINLGST